jgi:predicted  nucleic acid-binding Zn-ribbon protein
MSQPNLPVSGDQMAELASRLEQLDQLLNRLEDAEREAADASEDLRHTRAWQEEMVRAIQEERARMLSHRRALEDLAERAHAAVEALAVSYRTLPPEVHELAVELHVLATGGFIPRRLPRPPRG